MLGGVVTFLTMAYIVVVNPAILGAAKMPVEAVDVATALAASIFTLAMGLFTNLPFALASGLGLNAVVAFDLILGRGLPWQVAMACVVIEGVVALVLVLVGLREAIMRAVPMEIKLSIGVGIGLFIALVGFRDAGITINNDATGIGLGILTAGPPMIALAGLLTMIVLTARGFRGAILVGIIVSTVLGLIFGVLDPPDKVAEFPSSSDFSTIGDALAPSNLADAITWALVPVIFVLFVSDFFDTIGTAVAVSSPAACWTRTASRRGSSSCCSSTPPRPRAAARWASRASPPMSSPARAWPRARAPAWPRWSPRCASC